MRGLQHCIAIGLLATGISALPFVGQNLTELYFGPEGNPVVRRGLSDNIQLRILPLGASIVYGLTSTDGNGFRYGLRNQLIYGGNPVNMIGSVQSGNMADNDVEGWPGYTIDQVASMAENSISNKPNVILLHVGTNDMIQNNDVANAHNRLATLIDRLISAIPDVTIIASTLLPNGNSGVQPRADIYNKNIAGIVKSRQAAGKKILHVDFSSSYFTLADIGSDGTHPTNAGYLKMAAVWYQGLQLAASTGWLKAPATVDGVSDVIPSGGSTCDQNPGNAIGPYQTQLGSGTDDGAYAHTGVLVAGLNGFSNPASVGFNNTLPQGVYWADINGDGVDDYVYVGANANLGLGVALNLGNGDLGTYLWFSFSSSCLRSGVRFADMTGDGRDDICCLGANGDLACWQNTPGADARSPTWVDMGTIKTNEGFPQAQVRLADIDGDGRADYVCFDATGTQIKGWRNGATGNLQPAYWYDMQGVASDLPKLELSGWRFADLNGDHRDDLVWVDVNGRVTTWINQRGRTIGLTPVWVSMGATHGGSLTPQNVTFGAFMGSGRSDYSLVSVSSTGNVAITRYRNQDQGGTMVKGDGVKYCDMTGSGSDDYIWVSPTGEMTLYGNIHTWGSWKQWGVIYNANRARKEIHLADFDGDGKCDILLVDRASGATTMIRNDFTNGKFNFTSIGVVTGAASCTEGYGYDIHDLGVRWSDLDGDGRADFLCMQADGTISGYLNKGVGNMVSQGVIKHAEGRERKNLRLADIDGDGRNDLLYVNMITGEVIAWKNGGAIPTGGSAFSWILKGTVSSGNIARGSCIEFPSLYGLGRADYLVVYPQTNEAYASFNVCPGGGLDPVIPNLPTGAPDVPAITPATT